MKTAKFGQVAEQLRANGYAPAPIANDIAAPSGAWNQYQLQWGAEHANDSVAVLCALPPPRSPQHGPETIANNTATWLAALVVSVPHAQARAAIDAVLAKHVQPGPVRVTDATTHLFQLHGVAFNTIRRDFKGIGHVDLIADGFVPLNGEWPGGDPLTTARGALPVMDLDTANALMAAIEAAVEPFVPMPANVWCPPRKAVPKSARDADYLRLLVDKVGPETVAIAVAHDLGVDAATMRTYLSGDVPVPQKVLDYVKRLADMGLARPAERTAAERSRLFESIAVEQVHLQNRADRARGADRGAE